MDDTTKPVQPNFKELINLYLKLSFLSKIKLQTNGAIKEAHINANKKSIKSFIQNPPFYLLSIFYHRMTNELFL